MQYENNYSARVKSVAFNKYFFKIT